MGPESEKAPENIVATAKYNDVTVQIRSFEHEGETIFVDRAELIAESMSLVTQEIWPASKTPVNVDFYIMPP